MAQKQIFVVQGPTASGKTALAIALARQLQTEVISFDSRQFYTELSIGVARPSIEELEAVRHHFIGSHSIEQALNAANFAALAQPILSDLLQNKGSAVLVGGSALYADALLLGLDALPHDQAIHLKWKSVFENEGLHALQQALQQHDPDFFEQIDIENPARLIRALEINELTGQSNLALRKGPRKDPPNVVRIFINWPRASLYKRIDARVDIMIADGLEQEARHFFSDQAHLQALQTVGYREFFAHFEGNLSREEAVEKIKQHTRNYAKRQLTWLGRYDQIRALDPQKAVAAHVEHLLKIG